MWLAVCLCWLTVATAAGCGADELKRCERFALEGPLCDKCVERLNGCTTVQSLIMCYADSHSKFEDQQGAFTKALRAARYSPTPSPASARTPEDEKHGVSSAHCKKCNNQVAKKCSFGACKSKCSKKNVAACKVCVGNCVAQSCKAPCSSSSAMDKGFMWVFKHTTFYRTPHLWMPEIHSDMREVHKMFGLGKGN